MEKVRINKYISLRLGCSRRQADRLIADGRVLVNGVEASPGMKIGKGDIVTACGTELNEAAADSPVLIAFYKPRGLVCSSSHADRSPTIYDFIGSDRRLFSIGRLDKDSEGLLLLTNRGELVNKINKSINGHEKEYIVSVKRPIDDKFIRKMAGGVTIKIPSRRRDGEFKSVKTKPCAISKIDDYNFDIILTEGLNRQIRRMCLSCGNKVTCIKRVRIMNIGLKGLKQGNLREICGEELAVFERMLTDQKGTTQHQYKETVIS